MAKGLDNKFLHYGIRKEDMSLIEALWGKRGNTAQIPRQESGRNRNNRHGDGSRHQSGHPANPIK